MSFFLEVRKDRSREVHPGAQVIISALNSEDQNSWAQNGLTIGSKGVVQIKYFGRSLVLFQSNKANPNPFRYTIPTGCISVASQ